LGFSRSDMDQIDAAYWIADGEMPNVGDAYDKTKFKVSEVKSSPLLATSHSEQIRRLNLRDCDGKATIIHTNRIYRAGAWIDNPRVKAVDALIATKEFFRKYLTHEISEYVDIAQYPDVIKILSDLQLE